MQSVFIDTHAHIYLPEFKDELKTILEEAKQAGVGNIYMPAIDSSTHEVMLQAELSYPFCKSMMGLHPCYVKENFETELAIVEKYFQERKFAAVGEIGLDFYWDKTYTEQQYEVFHKQIALSLQYNLPIVIHSRNATDECIEVIMQYPTARGVLHCFSGDEKQARKIMEAGFMLGIGGVITFKNSGLDKVVAAVGLSHLVLETDSPYLAPVPFRGKQNKPGYTKLVAEKIADLLKCSVEEVATFTTANAEKLFGMGQKP